MGSVGSLLFLSSTYFLRDLSGPNLDGEQQLTPFD